jgi:hypothetical protein
MGGGCSAHSHLGHMPRDFEDFDWATAEFSVNITNFTFHKILVLMLSLTLEVLDLAETENVADTGTNLDFGIVGEKAIGNTMFTDEVL